MSAESPLPTPTRCVRCGHDAHSTPCEEVVAYYNFPKSGSTDCGCRHGVQESSATPQEETRCRCGHTKSDHCNFGCLGLDESRTIVCSCMEYRPSSSERAPTLPASDCTYPRCADAGGKEPCGQCESFHRVAKGNERAAYDAANALDVAQLDAMNCNLSLENEQLRSHLLEARKERDALLAEKPSWPSRFAMATAANVEGHLRHKLKDAETERDAALARFASLSKEIEKEPPIFAVRAVSRDGYAQLSDFTALDRDRIVAALHRHDPSQPPFLPTLDRTGNG